MHEKLEGQVKRFERLKWWGAGAGAADEQPENVSPDLPYELQSKMFDQLATVSIAGAGLAITLIGSLLRNASLEVWLSVIFFGLAAITAVSGNIRLIDGVFRRRPILRRSKLDIAVAMTLIGAAAGFLSMSVYSEGTKPPANAESADMGR